MVGNNESLRNLCHKQYGPSRTEAATWAWVRGGISPSPCSPPRPPYKHTRDKVYPNHRGFGFLAFQPETKTDAAHRENDETRHHCDETCFRLILLHGV